VEVSSNCFIGKFSNLSMALVAGPNGFQFATVDDKSAGAAADILGPRLLDPMAVRPPSGVSSDGSVFTFYFNEVIRRGPGPIAIVRILTQNSLNIYWHVSEVVDSSPLIDFDRRVPGKVTIFPTFPLDPGSTYEVVFGPGSLQDVAGNMVSCSRDEASEGVPSGFGLSSSYLVPVLPTGGVQAPREPEVAFAAFPSPGGSMHRQSNLVLEFTHSVAQGPYNEFNAVLFCFNWTTTNVCLEEVSIPVTALLFLGRKVMINPSFDLKPDRHYNVSMATGVIEHFPGLRADSYGKWPFGFSIMSKASRDLETPVLVAIHTDCTQSSWFTSSAMPGAAHDGSGCGWWDELP
ncbi:unnamed protein product, partial [Polarella glacialis]